MQYKKIYDRLDGKSYFTTIWCTLDPSINDFIHESLRPIQKYCRWLSTFGDADLNPRYKPHISLRYLGYTNELKREALIKDIPKFSATIANTPKSITVGGISIWERMDGDKVQAARLNLVIEDKSSLTAIHKELLKVPGYYLFQQLEGENYDPHISLGEILLEGDNLDQVRSYLEQDFQTRSVGLERLAINYPKEGEREEFPIL